MQYLEAPHMQKHKDQPFLFLQDDEILFYIYISFQLLHLEGIGAANIDRHDVLGGFLDKPGQIWTATGAVCYCDADLDCLSVCPNRSPPQAQLFYHHGQIDTGFEPSCLSVVF